MAFTDQFGHPRGLVGSLVGHLMALKNTARSRWVLELLAPQPGERVIEIGFGSGTDVQRVLQRVGPSGSVAGVDVSAAMLRQASGRNRGPITRGRVALSRGDASALPFEDASFDAAFSINSAQFWPDLARGFRETWRVVREGGRVLVAVQPMQRGASADDSKRWGDALVKAAREAGWVDADELLGPTAPPVAAVLARKRSS
jgi:SAM-dependent methyltransferase